MLVQSRQNIGGMGMSEKLQFIKMEGTGNDYVYVDCFDQYVLNPQAFSRRVSDRHLVLAVTA